MSPSIALRANGFCFGLLALLLVLCASSAAKAQANFGTVASDSAQYYTGAVFRYQLRYTGASNVQLISINFFDYLDIVGVDCGAGAAFDSASLAACSAAGPPYNCSAVTCPGGSGVNVSLGTSGSAQNANFVLPGGGTSTSWPILTVAVRMHGSAGNVCGTPIAHLRDTSNIDVGDIADPNNAVNAACQSGSRPTLLSVGPTISPLVIPRSNPPTNVSWQLTGTLSNGGSVSINAPIADAAGLAATMQCAVGAGAASSCTSGPFASVVQLGPQTVYPASLMSSALNTPDPVPGNASILVTLPYMTASSTIPVVLESNVATLSVAEASGQTQTVPGTPSRFILGAALNAQGGEEPRLAQFSITGVTSGGTPLTTAQSWLVTTDAHSATLNVPVPQASPLDLVVHAAHANPDGSTTANDLAWHIAANSNVVVPTPTPGTCELVADATTLGAGDSTTVRVIVSDANGATADAVVDAVFTASTGSVAKVGPNAVATYTAPASEGTVQVSAAFDAPTICPQTSLSTTLTVVSNVHVQLAADENNIAPGGLLHLTASLQNVGSNPITGVAFALRGGTVFSALGVLPSGPPGSGVAALPNAPRDGGTYFTLPLQPSGKINLRAALLPRQAHACSTGTVTLTAYRDATLAMPIADSNVSVKIACDPEMSEATVFGRVFVDRNGNGRADADEPGLPHVMVALSSGIYARTDAMGRYHIARLSPGRQAIKVNAATLPAGAHLPPRLAVASHADGRAEITLTPGEMRRVNFPVVIPDLLDDGASITLEASGSGVVFVSGRVVYRARLRLAQGWSVVSSGDAVARRDGDAWLVDVPMPDDTTHITLAAATEDGRVELASLALYVDRGPGGTRLVHALRPRALARLALPSAQNAIDPTSTLSIHGALLSGGTLRVSRDSDACVGTTRDFRCELPGRRGAGELELDVHVEAEADASGDKPPTLAYRHVVATSDNVHFFVGLAGGEVSHVIAGDASASNVDWAAGGSFYYRGVIHGRYLVTAGADASAREVLLGADGSWRGWTGTLSTLLAHDATRVFRYLDPEAYYPVYGDTSTTVDEREAGGRFFVRLQLDESYVKWGGINTALDGVEVGRYVRSMYGLGGRMAWQADSNDVAANAVFFAAQPDSVAARDELVVTGSSLYYLSHRDVVEGSLRVTLEVLDEISALPIRSVPLTEGLDYTAKYALGHLSLDQALAYRSGIGSITGRGTTGATARMLIEYEYLPGGDVARDWTLGGRAGVGVGPLRVDVTAATELLSRSDDIVGAPSYTLLGSGAALDMGKPLQVRVEVAHSQGTSHAMARSVDGGLSWTPAPASDDQRGGAIAAEVASAADFLTGRVYGRYYQPGFTDSRTAQGTRLSQVGARLELDPWRSTRLWTQADYKDLSTPYGDALRAGVALAGASQRLGAWGVSLEGRYEDMHPQTGGGTDAVGGARLTYDFNADVSAYARRRQTLWASPGFAYTAGESALGAAIDTQAWHAGGELGVNDRRDAFGRVTGGAPLSDTSELYGGVMHALRMTPTQSADMLAALEERGSAVILGGRQRTRGVGTLFAEQHLRVDGEDRNLTRLVGGETRLGSRATLSFSYERGALDAVLDANSIGRDAGSVGLLLAGSLVQVRLGLDARLDRRPGGRTAQAGGQARVEMHPGEPLTLALALRGGSAWDARTGGALQPGQSAWEGAVGFAFRPLDDWLSAFGRYAVTVERGRDDAVSVAHLQSTSQIGALSLVARVWGPFALGPKVAYRYTQYRGAGINAVDRALLAALRGDVTLAGAWDLGLESRACSMIDGANATRWGALAEASVLTLSWLRLGAGYNFSSMAVGGVRCYEPGARGAFVRAETVY